MSLLERAMKLSEKVASLSALRDRAGKAEIIEQRAKTLSNLADDLGQLQPPALAFSASNIHVPALDRKLIAALRIRTAGLRERFSSDRGTILDPLPGEDFRNVYVNPLSQCAKKTSNTLLEAWGTWAADVLPKIDNEMLGVLEKIPGLASQVLHIRQLKKEAEAILAIPPHSIQAVENLRSLSERMLAAWQSLAGDGIQPAVLQFLRAAGSPAGASYALLTEEVFDWLSAHRLSDSLRVRLGSHG